ncbi:MAG: hypothetical protein WCG27_07225 [Pseudomonadota bacterium]
MIVLCQEELKSVVAKIEANASLSEVREDYERVLVYLIPLAEKDKNTRLQARVRNIQTQLKNGSLSEKKNSILEEISRLNSHLNSILEKEEEKNVIFQTPAATAKKKAKKSVEETIEESTEKMTEETTAVAKEAQTIAPNETSDSVKERIIQLQEKNSFILREVEKITTENQEMFAQNKVLQEQYSEVLKNHGDAKEIFRLLQNKVASTQLECNRLLLEIQFSSDERTRMSQELERSYSLLVEMAKRHTELQRGFLFTKGESVVFDDLLTQLYTMLGKTRNEKIVLSDRMDESKKSIESLVEELKTVIKKGKTQFYSSMQGGERV